MAKRLEEEATAAEADEDEVDEVEACVPAKSAAVTARVEKSCILSQCSWYQLGRPLFLIDLQLTIAMGVLLL